MTKKISFVISSGDAIAKKVAALSEEYEIPLNSAFKVFCMNLIKENDSLKEQLSRVDRIISNTGSIQHPVLVSTPQVINTKNKTTGTTSGSSTQENIVLQPQKKENVNVEKKVVSPTETSSTTTISSASSATASAKNLFKA